MKECPRCKITFYLDDRIRCLYCDTLLKTVQRDRTDLNTKMDTGLNGLTAQPIIDQIVREHGVEAYTRHQFIIASYFRTRTFHFMYAFSRNEFKMGQRFERELIQPFRLTSLLVLPWLVVNIFDSFLCRLIYTKYCPKCGWKFFKRERSGEHQHEECEYNREYKQVVDCILRGEIMKEESTFKRLGMMKRNAGRRSAYWDLCQGTDFFSSFLDIATIWFSISVWILLFVSLLFPSIIRGVYMLEV